MSIRTQVLVMSRDAFEKRDLKSKAVAISITSPGTTYPLPGGSYEDVLSLQFWDVTTGYMGGMSQRDAARAAQFVQRWFGKVDYLVVHCEMGISRSAGVAAAILMHFDGNAQQIFANRKYMPNMWCYQQVRSELKKISKDKIWKLCG